MAVSKRAAKGGTGKTNVACKFRFNVYWHDEFQRWYMPKQQGGCSCHTGHVFVPPYLLRHRAKTVGRRSLESSKNAFLAQVSASSVRRLINEETGIELDPSQAHDLRRKAMNESLILHIAALGSGVDPENATAADRLLAELHKNPKISYTVLFGDYDNSGSLTIKRRKRNSARNGEYAIHEESLDLVDPLDSAKKHSKRIKDSLSVTGTNQILLGLCWTHDEARRKFDLFPEFGTSDATEDTNIEERPLFLWAAKDGENRSFVHTWAFLPSQSRWVFDWFFGEAVPFLHKKLTLERVVMNVTDQCPQECSAFMALCGEGRIYKNAVHRLCSWHVSFIFVRISHAESLF